MTNRLSTTSSNATVEENHPVGGIVFDAEEVAEGIPAAFAGAAAKFEAKEGRFRDLADAVRPAGDPVLLSSRMRTISPKPKVTIAVVAAQTQHREAQQETGRRGDRAGQRETGPEAETVIVVQQRKGIRADGIEPAVASTSRPERPTTTFNPRPRMI